MIPADPFGYTSVMIRIGCLLACLVPAGCQFIPTPSQKAEGTGGDTGTGDDGTGDGGTVDGTAGDDMCTPFCGPGWQCGHDGCGGSCGTCALGECNAEHQCIEECKPFCQPGWQCGTDGCGGTCGSGCAPGQVCNNAQHACEEDRVPPDRQAYGAACGRKGQCQPLVDAPDGPVDNPIWPQCLHAQCDSGLCLEPVCAAACTIAKDEVDHAGVPGPDGIDDPDADFDDCAGAVDGPFGTEFTCVQVSGPEEAKAAYCQPGTTFAPCDAGADCPDGQTCQLQYVLGAYGARCATAPKGAVEISRYCNRNPELGDVAYCETGLCFGMGCTGFCTDDDDCGDFECRANAVPFPTEPELTFDMCWAPVCQSGADCAAEGQHCAISGNGETGEAIDWEHLCVASPPNAAALGEDCEDDPTDNVPKPDCAGPCLNDGTCSAICEGAADCAAVETMQCDANVVPVDYEGDGVDDKFLPLGLCVDHPGSNTACARDADCPEGEACTLRAFFSEDEPPIVDAAGLCTTVSPGEAVVGDACGGNSAVSCRSGFCLGSNGDQPGYCSALCGSKADCPDGVSLGLFQGTYNLYCRGLVFSPGLAAGTEEDSIYVPLCIPAPAETSPLTECTGHATCDVGEACWPVAIAMGATGPTALELRCLGAGVFDDSGQFLPATAAYGAACDASLESADPAERCQTNLCLPDDDGAGYCSRLCTSPDDCTVEGHTCAPHVLVDRVGDEADLTVDLCQPTAGDTVPTD